MVPIVIYVQFDNFVLPTWAVSVWTVFIGLLMVSTVPTIALKSVRVPPRLFTPLIVVLVFALVAFFFQPRVVALIGLATLPAAHSVRVRPVPLPGRASGTVAGRAGTAGAPTASSGAAQGAVPAAEGFGDRWIDSPPAPRPQRMRDPRSRLTQRRDGTLRRSSERD